MSDDVLAAATAALREAAASDPGMAPEATRLRLRRSLEATAKRRHRSGGFLIGVAVLFGGSAWAWKLASPRSAPVAVHTPVASPAPAVRGEARRAPPEPALIPALIPAPPAQAPDEVAQAPAAPAPTAEDLTAVPRPKVTRTRAPAVERTTARPAGDPVAAPPTQAAVTARPPQAPEAGEPPATASERLEPLFAAAHDLHFHGGDPATTLAAWDAYLATEPTGRFVVEATYNRALVLARLKRYVDARAALAPFARGDVLPRGYRQTEAKQLLQRLPQ